MTDVETYLSGLAGSDRAALEAVCATVRRLAPGAEETTSYGVPSFKWRGKLLLGFAAGKEYLSLYPTAEPIAELGPKLGRFVGSKGSVHFTAADPIPQDLLEELIHYRISRIEGS